MTTSSLRPTSRAGHRPVAVLAGRRSDDRYSIHRSYIDALWAVGALPLIVPAGDPADLDRLCEMVAGCDALVVTGGHDVDPSSYGGAAGHGEEQTDVGRDRLELAAVHVAISSGLPVLGICRGHQLLTVANGGSLVADLPAAGFLGHWEDERAADPVHEVSADPLSQASRLLDGLGAVNSIHHQAVDDPGPTLRATAWSVDGVTEAVEGPGMLGVQWHPERLIERDPRHLAPFRWALTA